MNDENTRIQIPEAVERFAKKYQEKHPGSLDCCHNIYHLVAEDLDGNIVDEAFGLNLMTDYGFEYTYKVDNWGVNYMSYMYLGDGDFQTLDPTSKTMVNAISNTSATMTQTSWTYIQTDYISAMESDRIQYRLCQGWFDYTVWDVDHTVTEIGVASNYSGGVNNLKFHSAIYDSEGQKSSFVKKVNQKLTISVYVRAYVPIKKIVNQSWDAGVPCVLNSRSLIKNKFDDYFSKCAAHYHAYNWSTSGSTSWYAIDTGGSIVDHVYSANRTGGIAADDSHGFIDNFYQYFSEVTFSSKINNNNNGDSTSNYDTHFIFLSKIHTPEPVPFQVPFYRTIGCKTSSLKDTYGSKCRDSYRDPYGQLSASNIHVTDISLYNGQTDDWDITVPFTEPTAHLDYGYHCLRCSVAMHGYVDHFHTYSNFRVWINEAPQYPIKSIIDCNKTIYVTDEYWDSTTWELVADVTNISRSQGAKRFFIIVGDNPEFGRIYTDSNRVHDFGVSEYTRIVTRYDYDDHFQSLNTGKSWGEVYFGYRNNGKYSGWEYWDSNMSGKYVKNETIEYIAGDGFLLYPESANPNPSFGYYTGHFVSGSCQDYPYIYYLGGVDLPDASFGELQGYNQDGQHPGLIFNTTRGEHIACVGCKSYLKGVRVYEPNSDPSIAPTYDNFLYDQVFEYVPTWSSSDTGYYVAGYIQGSTNVNCTYVVEYDVPNVQPNMYKVEGYHHAFAIDLTSYFVAIDSTVSDHIRVVIYDMENRQVHDTFDIPSGFTFQGFAGWKNFVYVRVSSGSVYSTYVYYIDEQMLEATTIDINNMDLNTNWTWHNQYAVEANGNIESCMVLVSGDRYSNRDTTYQYPVLFKESDPTHPIKILRDDQSNVSQYVKCRKGWLGYSSDNKQLILTYSAKYAQCLDVGWVTKHDTITKRMTNGDLYDSDACYNSIIYYKGYIYHMWLYCREDRSGSRGNNGGFERYPAEQFMDLQISGTTYSPNAMMNPVRMKGNIGTTYYAATNRDVDTAPSPYVPPL